MASQTPTTGFYGKLMRNGDFVRRRFPNEVYQIWDPWLQQGMLFSRTALGEHWLDAYLSAPIWRFVLSPGLAGNRLLIGAMMPSVDRVGRYFPITVIHQTPAGTGLFSAAYAAESWLDRIEAALLETLEGDGISADVLAERIASASESLSVNLGATAPSSALIERDEGIGIQMEADLEMGAISRHLAGLLATRLLGEPVSLWWSHGSNLVTAGARLYRGLPMDTGFARLLSDDSVPTEPTTPVHSASSPRARVSAH
ncbi:type VI secretion system-associated protein TagF [Lamprobacter sp.]|uniref:type VI secretion system-associated protein TagF n=1 Tax=Lamprobacter sp. TaxID=3100796 RepID=UPI003A4D91E5